MDKNVKQDLMTLSSARVFFAHMSVGDNIIEGLSEILDENNISDVTIRRHEQVSHPNRGFLLHMPVGKNTEPLTKCRDFKRIINKRLKDKIDYALLKFCYIDINHNTDVHALFSSYQKTIRELKTANNDIVLIHVTVPLRYSASGFGVWIREILGRPNKSKLDNIKRNDFNELLRNTYSNEPIFDLAKSESTFQNGKRQSFTYKDSKTYYSLIGDYTDDGGHLNKLGRKIVAEEFIHTLAEIIKANSKVE